VKTVHVVHTFPPYSRAGSENYVEALAKAQLANHKVLVFHRVAESDQLEYELRSGSVGPIPVQTINRTFRDLTSFRDTYESAAVTAAFSELLDRETPDVLHFHHLTCLSLTCVRAARERGIPVIFTLHDFWLLCPRGQLVRRDQSLCDRHTDVDCVRCMASQLRVSGRQSQSRVKALWERLEAILPVDLPKDLARRIASRPFARESEALAEIRERHRCVQEMFGDVDLFIAPSAFLADRFVEYGIPVEKIRALDYGFEISHWSTAPPARPREPGAPLRVAYLGTWIPTKGVHILVEALRGLDPGIAVLDVHGYATHYEGHEDYEASIRALAADAPHIRFRGAYAPEQIPELLGDADVLVVPSSWYENSPLTVHEGFLAGLAVVVSNHGGLRGLIQNEVNGLTFEPGDPRSLRAVLSRLANDPALLARLRSRKTPVIPMDEHAEVMNELYAAAGAREKLP
jgi:glycosyltransferase involved in cell wall biosynthesis